MSTKIFHGYKVDIASLSKLHKMSLELKKKIVREAERYSLEFIVRIATNLKDETLISAHTPEDLLSGASSLGAACMKFQNRLMECRGSGKRDPAVDIDASWTFLPLEQYTLAIFYSDNKYADIWESHPSIKYYGYWDNVDPDPNCTREEWEQRAIDWEKTGVMQDAHATLGFTFNVFSTYGGPYHFNDKKLHKSIEKAYESSSIKIGKVKDRVHWYAIIYLVEELKGNDTTASTIHAIEKHIQDGDKPYIDKYNQLVDTFARQLKPLYTPEELSKT